MIDVAALAESVEKMGALFSNASSHHHHAHHYHPELNATPTTEGLRHRDGSLTVAVLLLVSMATLAGVVRCACAILSEHAMQQRQRGALAAGAIEVAEDDCDAEDEEDALPPLDPPLDSKDGPRYTAS